MSLSVIDCANRRNWNDVTFVTEHAALHVYER